MAGHGPGPLDPGFDPTDPEYGLTPEGATYEHTDAHTGLIARFLFWLLVTAILVHVGLGFMYQMLVDQGARVDAANIRYPLAVSQPEQLPPLPRLQAKPANEIYEFRRSEEALLHSYGWQNQAAGTVRIPIEEAMRIVVERGLPARAEAPPVEPGLMPADSSSGRTLIRRR